MKKELEEFQKAYAEAMKNEIDYSNADFKDSDFLPDWAGFKSRVDGVLIDFSFSKSNALFVVHNFIDSEAIIKNYFTDDEKQELHKKVVDAYYRKRLKSLDSKIDELMKEKEKISEEKISEEKISVEQNQTI